KEIAELKNLQRLDLDSNQLKELPKEIAELKNLQRLDLGDNQIKEETKESIKKLLPQCEISF
ncbi:MAG: leucine-rich repeat domain-containing protein, partial [Bacteroidetes bacterium]|nr:leucine-rich repeat domain-containing protein [Bacteroidota bacterium]